MALHRLRSTEYFQPCLRAMDLIDSRCLWDTRTAEKTTGCRGAEVDLRFPPDRRFCPGAHPTTGMPACVVKFSLALKHGALMSPLEYKYPTDQLSSNRASLSSGETVLHFVQCGAHESRLACMLLGGAVVEQLVKSFIAHAVGGGPLDASATACEVGVPLAVDDLIRLDPSHQPWQVP